jgi:hypothetical protein
VADCTGCGAAFWWNSGYGGGVNGAVLAQNVEKQEYSGKTWFFSDFSLDKSLFYRVEYYSSYSSWMSGEGILHKDQSVGW